MATGDMGWIRSTVMSAGLIAAGFCCASVEAAAQCGTPGTHRYAGAVAHYIADLKTSFPEHSSYSSASALSERNYRAVLEGLSQNVGVDGIRLPIVVNYASAGSYSPLYRDVVAFARSLGLLIYASPLSVGKGAFAGWSDDRYASWLADYAAAFRPDALSPFNEAGMDDARMADIVTLLRARLGGSVLLVGPDKQHVSTTLADLGRGSPVEPLFDVVGSHNANGDGSATAGNWSQLVAAAGKPVWSSENPAGWSGGQRQGLPGLDAAVSGGVQAIVIWKGKPSLVDDAGRATAKACAISAHLMGGP